MSRQILKDIYSNLKIHTYNKLFQLCKEYMKTIQVSFNKIQEDKVLTIINYSQDNNDLFHIILKHHLNHSRIQLSMLVFLKLWLYLRHRYQVWLYILRIQKLLNLFLSHKANNYLYIQDMSFNLLNFNICHVSILKEIPFHFHHKKIQLDMEFLHYLKDNCWL
jgi:hypothetical protein